MVLLGSQQLQHILSSASTCDQQSNRGRSTGRTSKKMRTHIAVHHNVCIVAVLDLKEVAYNGVGSQAPGKLTLSLFALFAPLWEHSKEVISERHARWDAALDTVNRYSIRDNLNQRCVA